MVLKPHSCNNYNPLSVDSTRALFLLNLNVTYIDSRPMGLAASILYIASQEAGEIKTQRDMAVAAGVTEVTIRNRIRTLAKDLNLFMV